MPEGPVSAHYRASLHRGEAFGRHRSEGGRPGDDRVGIAAIAGEAEERLLTSRTVCGLPSLTVLAGAT